MKERERAVPAAAAGLALLAALAAPAIVRARASAAEPSPAHTAADEREAFLAALGAEARVITRGVPPAGQPVLCVAIDPGDAPQSAPAEFVQRLAAAVAGTATRLARSAECEVRARATVELATGARAVLLTAGPVEWTAGDEALVTVRETRRRGDTTRKQYRVVRENGRWIALGPVWKMSPA